MENVIKKRERCKEDMEKSVKSTLKEKANEFTAHLGELIEETDWYMGTETTTINPKKLEKTKITIQFEIKDTILDDIKSELKRVREKNQSSLEKYQNSEKNKIKEK